MYGTRNVTRSSSGRSFFEDYCDNFQTQSIMDMAKISLKEAKEQAELRAIEAVASNKAKSDFLANVSHELRTPLNAIIGFAEVLKMQPNGKLGHESYEEYVTDIHDSGVHLLHLINDILDLSKVEAGLYELQYAEVDIETVIDSASRLVKPKMDENQLTFQRDIRNPLPTMVGDERKLKQVLINLLANAAKFTPAGGIVRISAAVSADGRVLIDVADSGIGMKEEDIPLALEPFVQVDSDLDRKYAGTGLGLPLSKAFIESHGGQFSIESEIGVGTTVKISLPAKLKQDSEPENMDTPDEVSSPSDPGVQSG